MGTRAADRVVASVFVNPTQFGPNEDFNRYPRDAAGDARMLADAGCDALYLPDAAAMALQAGNQLLYRGFVAGDQQQADFAVP